MRRCISAFFAAGMFLPILAPTSHADWSGTIADRQISFDDDGDAQGVRIVSDSYGYPHVFWCENPLSARETVREVHYGTLAGDDFWTSELADRQISFSDGNSVYEEVAITADGPGQPSGHEQFHLVWSEVDVTTREVHFGRSTDGGLSFSSESADFVISDPSTKSDTGIPSLLVRYDPGLFDANVVHVVWDQSNGGSSEIHYSRSTDGGDTWSGTTGDRVISFPDGNDAIDPKLELGSNGRIVLVWIEPGDAGLPAVHMGFSDDKGETWSCETGDREISQPMTQMTDLDVSGWGGSVHVVHAGSLDASSPYHYEIYTTSSTNNGITWTGETELVAVSFDEDHTRSAHHPAVLSVLCGGVTVVWDEEEDASGTSEQHISRFLDNTWTGATADEIISLPDGEDGYRPALAALVNYFGPPDTVPKYRETVVAWTELNGSSPDNYEVHISTNELCDPTSADDPWIDVPRPQIHVSPNPAWDRVQFEVEGEFLTEPWNAAVGMGFDVFDAAGRRIRSLAARLEDSRSAKAAVWDLRDQSGRKVPAGLYFVRALPEQSAEATPVVVR